MIRFCKICKVNRLGNANVSGICTKTAKCRRARQGLPRLRPRPQYEARDYVPKDEFTEVDDIEIEPKTNVFGHAIPKKVWLHKKRAEWERVPIGMQYKYNIRSTSPNGDDKRNKAG